MSKVIDEVVFKKSIEDMLQYLSDNCLYEFVPYDDTEISNLFSLSPEEAQRLSELISDEVVSKYKLWSSSKVNDSLIAAKSECNDYTDKMLSNISSISIKYVDTLPSSNISTSTIYILKNTTGGNDTLNLYDGGTWTSIGEFTISLDDFYKKSEMDTKLNDKANKTEVLLQDDVIVNKTLATTSNVLSAKTMVDELDLKFDKSKILSVENDTATDNDVYSAKYVNDTYHIKTFTKPEQLGLADGCSVSDIFLALPDNSYFECGQNNPKTDVLYNITDVPTGGGLLTIRKQTQYRFAIEYKISGGGSLSPNELYIGQLKGNDGSGLTWSRACLSKVADVGVTTIATFEDSTYYVPNASGCKYCVKNGVCFVELMVDVVTPKNGWTSKLYKMPAPVFGFGINVPAHNPKTTTVPTVIGIQVTFEGDLLLFSGEAGKTYVATFTYPVAE